jgi:hypothetical protein
MATPFDSFDRSPLEGFVQSPLLARGPLAPAISRTVNLSFGVTPTPAAVKYPRFLPWYGSTQYIQRYRKVGEDLVFYDEYSLFGSGSVFSAGSGCYYADYEWRRQRRRSGTVTIPLDLPSGAEFRVRMLPTVQSYPAPAEIYIANQTSACSFNGPATASFLGTASPGADQLFDPGALTPGQQYYLFARVVDDMQYIDLANPYWYEFWVNSNGVNLRLEIYI